MIPSFAPLTAMPAQRKRLIRHFQNASAFDSESAIAPESLPRAGFRLVDKLKEQHVIRTAPNGRLYLDQARWMQTRSARWSAAILILGAALVVGLIVWALTTIYGPAV